MYEPMDLGHHGAPYFPTHPNILRRAKLCPAQAASNYVGGHHSDERRFDGSLLELDMTRVSQLNPPELHLDIDVFLGYQNHEHFNSLSLPSGFECFLCGAISHASVNQDRSPALESYTKEVLPSRREPNCSMLKD